MGFNPLDKKKLLEKKKQEMILKTHGKTESQKLDML